MKKIVLLFLFVFSLSLNAQYLRVYFIDKGENSALVKNPYRFLSSKSIALKAKRGISINQSDVPVSNVYVKALQEAGAEVKLSSRWFNYALVSGVNQKVLEQFYFVKEVEKVSGGTLAVSAVSQAKGTQALTYGESDNQIKMVRGDFLHDQNFLGQGMTIAVIDGGFSGATNAKGLDSVWAQNRVLGTYDFVQNDTDVFDVGSHGTKVFSIMAGIYPNHFVGSAPKANYWLLKSEDEISEHPIEMDYWLQAAEFADSVGVDVINSSLGYNLFDDPSFNMSYQDLDGNTALITKAADKAAEKGILVVVSAGNEGLDAWKHIGAPADGDSVLSVGAVDYTGSYVAFSSQGPTADGRLKPDVSARGAATAFLGLDSALNGNGTSFSSPIIAGLAACLWQCNDSLSNMTILNAIKQGASQPFTPDNLLGFGIANFKDAHWTIGLEDELESTLPFKIVGNPATSFVSIKFSPEVVSANRQLQLWQLDGKPIQQWPINNSNESIVWDLPREDGLYMIGIYINGEMYVQKLKVENGK